MTIDNPAPDEYAELRERLRSATSVNVSTFELLCAIEQTLSDLRLLGAIAGIPAPWDPALAALRTHATRTACVLWLEEDGYELAEIHRLATGLPRPSEVRQVRCGASVCGDARISEYSVTKPMVPECLTGSVVDYVRYIDAVRKWLHEPGAIPPSTVVGIRTSGSYLAPLWAAALPHGSVPACYTTVRPPSRRLTELLAAAWPWPTELRSTGTIRKASSIMVVDDSIGSGTTMDSAVAAIRAAAPDATVASLVHEKSKTPRPRTAVLTAVRRSIPPADSALSGAAQAYLAAAVSRLSKGMLIVSSVERLADSYWLRYLYARSGLRRHVLEAWNRGGQARRYRLTCDGPVRLVAKYVGFGEVVKRQVGALRRACAGPRVLGIDGGYLFYDWVPGTPLESGDPIDEADLEVVAATAAEVARAPAVLLPASRLHEWAEAACTRLRQERVPVPTPEGVVRALNGPVAARPAPPNHGHWHWVRAGDGRLLRFHRETARHWRSLESSEDIATAAIELQLPVDQVDRLRATYAALTGETVTDPTLAFGALRHAARVLKEYDHYDGLLERTPKVAGPREGAEPFLRRRSEIAARALALYRTLTS